MSGVHVDELLTWECHVDTICKKVSKGLRVLRRVKPFVPSNILFCIYNSLIAPHVDYCSSVWGSKGKGLSDKVQKLQNRAARIITGSNYDIRSRDILQQLGWKNLSERRNDQVACMMYKAMNGLVTSSLSQLFTKTGEIHNYSLRNSADSLFVPRPNSEALKKSFSYRGAIQWNALSENLTKASSFSVFKSNLSHSRS